MGYGMWAQAAGPGPAKPAGFYLNENIAVPQYITTMNSRLYWRNNKYARTQPIPGWDGQGDLLIIPNRLSWMGDFVNERITFTIEQMQVMSDRSLELKIPWDFVAETQDFTFVIYKMWPQADRGYGMSFYNSSDVMNITDAGTIGQCRWAWEGTIANSLSVPSFPNSFCFAHTNSSSVGLTYDGSTIRAYKNFSDADGRNNHDGASVYARIALFSNNSAGVPEHNGGFNIYSPDGRRCVFSSYGAPLIVPNRGQVGSINTGLQYPMGLLLPSYGGISGGDAQHMRSLIISGSTITTGFGARMYRGSGITVTNSLINYRAPYLDARNYFDSIGRKL